ncbi:hypothetical protein [Mesobacillus foraminis]|nr:hypothetical protein [Mesobacillus foraminis]
MKQAISMFFILLFLAPVHTAAEDPAGLYETVKEYLPPEAELIKPNEPKKASSIQSYDFDKDGIDEIVVTFRIKDTLKTLNIMLLKQENNSWRAVWEKAGEGFDFEYSGFEDITGDGTKEYVASWGIGASAGSRLEIFQWQNGSFNQIGRSLFYHEMELIQEGQGTSLAIWERYCCDAFIVDVLKWDGKELVPDEMTYSKYYQKVEDFYEAKLKEMDAWYYWFVLADAQLKAGLLEKAEASIKKGYSFGLAEEKFNSLRKQLEEQKAALLK